MGRRHQAYSSVFHAGKIQWTVGPHEGECFVKVRYQQEDSRCRVKGLGGDRCRVELNEPEVVAPGQSAVFYRDEIVLGGGFIE